MIICPSILEKKASAYLKMIKKLSFLFSYFQIDVAENQYVGNQTPLVDDILTSNFLSFVKEKNLFFDFHLMVKDYEKEIRKIVDKKNLLKIKNVFIHYDLSPDYQSLLKKYKINIGLVLNPQDQVNDLKDKYNLNIIKAIQIMSVYPGKQGQPFLKKMLKKIEQLRKLGYRSKIFLDGGINDKTFLLILKKRFQPDVICPGSYLKKILKF